MTDNLKNVLMAAGLTKQQATSVTAETLVNLFMQEDGKILIKEAEEQVAAMCDVVNDLRRDYMQWKHRFDEISKVLLAVDEAQHVFGEIQDEKAKNIIALYGALLKMNEQMGASADDSVKNAGYIVYAYLGGQAKRDISYAQDK